MKNAHYSSLLIATATAAYHPEAMTSAERHMASTLRWVCHHTTRALHDSRLAPL